MFIAGILPGIWWGWASCSSAGLSVGFAGYGKIAAHQTSMSRIFKAFLEAFPSLLLIVIVMGGILGGIFSVDGGVGDRGWLTRLSWPCFLYKEVRFRQVPKILLMSGITTAVVIAAGGVQPGDERDSDL
jgi:TRAP-type C4-dicarboxylate transport system permease large subunit